MLGLRLLYFSIGVIVILLIGCAFILPGCLKLPYSCSNSSDCPEESYCDKEVCVKREGPVEPGWKMDTFTAETRTTGNAKIEFQISVGNKPDLQPEGPWRSIGEMRKLGSREGRYLAMRARLVSDGRSKATLGRITVQGTNGQAEWLAAGRSARILNIPSGLEMVNGALTLQRAELATEDTELITDQFDDGSIDDTLWIPNITNTAQLGEQGGALWIRTNEGIDTISSEMTLDPLLRGDFQVDFNQNLEQWPAGDLSRPAKIEIAVSTDDNHTCIIRHTNIDSPTIEYFERWRPLSKQTEPAGYVPFRLTREESVVTALIKLDGKTWTSMGKCTLGTVDATLKFSVSPGYKQNVNNPGVIAVSWDDFKAATDAIVGYDQSSPEIEFETEDALLPRVKMTPESFVYVNEVTVSLAATSEASNIYYTLDGSDPANSPTREVYNQPLVLQKTTQLQAAADTLAGEMGPITSHQYYVGTALAHAPLDNTEADSEVAETINGWNGTQKKYVERGVPDAADVAGKAVRTYGNGGYLELPDSTKFESTAYQVNSGAVAIWFKTSHLDSRASILSKDSQNCDDGGHLSASLVHGEIRIRIQNTEESFFINTLAAPLHADRWHRLTVIFGQPQLTLMLWDEDKKLVGSWSNPYPGGLGKQYKDDTEFPGNEEPFALGANTSLSGDKTTFPTGGFFAGELDDFFFISLE